MRGTNLFYSIQSQTKSIGNRANRKNPSQAQYTNQWLCATRDTQVGQVQRRFTKMLESSLKVIRKQPENSLSRKEKDKRQPELPRKYLKNPPRTYKFATALFLPKPVRISKCHCTLFQQITTSNVLSVL